MKNLTCRQKIRGTIVVALLAAFVAAIPTGASAAPKLIVQDNLNPANDKFTVTDQGWIGVGVTPPLFPVHLIGAGDSGLTAMFFHNKGRVAVQPGDSPGLNFFRNNDSTVNSGLPRKDDRLGYFAFGSVINSSNKFLNTVQAYAEAAFTITSAPTYFTFGTTSPNALTASEKIRITGIGNVGIGTTAPTQKLEVNGGIRLFTGTTKTAVCDASLRGTIWFTQGANNSADLLQVCAKDASNAYDWRNLY